ncbi:hypothetical protein EIP86_008747 [Pleurotus ostreatoroseus]|nr:hypothetical protein EIP86_008747 [Pleurotus ostreatoroseus]
MPVPSKLPYDLHVEILACLCPRRDFKTLDNCSVVCEEWQTIAQRVLFTSFVARGSPAPTHFRCTLRFLDSHPHLCGYVKDLSIKNSVIERYQHGTVDLDPVVSASDVIQLAQKLPGIRSLSIEGVTYMGDDTWRGGLSDLQSLRLEGITCIGPRAEPTALFMLSSHIETVILSDVNFDGYLTRGQTPSHLSCHHLILRLNQSVQIPATTKSTSLINRIPTLQRVEELCVEGLVRNEVELMNRLLRDCRYTLRSLRIGLYDGEESGSADDWVLPDLRACTSLRTMTIRASLDTTFDMIDDIPLGHRERLLLHLISLTPPQVRILNLMLETSRLDIDEDTAEVCRLPWPTIGEYIRNGTKINRVVIVIPPDFSKDLNAPRVHVYATEFIAQSFPRFRFRASK